MTYVTVKQNRKPRQLTVEDILFNIVSLNDYTGDSDETGTVTKRFDEIKPEILKLIDVPGMINRLKIFNSVYKDLYEADKKSLYRHFKIPKKTGGWRPIDEPCERLQSALTELGDILTYKFGVLYHTAAYAYVEGRCTKNAAERHARFKSEWYLKTDISGFFPSTTLEFTMKMLSMVFPLSEIMKTSEGKEELTKAISLGFLNNGLPQGTTLSPKLTNCIMIPIDHTLAKEFSKRKMIYTRYADDMHISAREQFPYKEIVKIIKKVFKEFGAPYEIKDEKTHYGSTRGKNWMLGLMVNGEHNITVGHRAKKYFKAMICNFVLDTKNNKPWDIDDVQHLQGLLSYYRMIEKQYFNSVIERANNKWNVNVEEMMKYYLAIN